MGIGKGEVQMDLHIIATELAVCQLVAKEIFNELPLQQWRMFLHVMMQDGISQLDFQGLLGVPAGTVSRNLAKLGSKFVEDRNGKLEDVGYGLIEVLPDSTDPKRNTIYLTPKGVEFKNKFINLMSKNT